MEEKSIRGYSSHTFDLSLSSLEDRKVQGAGIALVLFFVH